MNALNGHANMLQRRVDVKLLCKAAVPHHLPSNLMLFAWWQVCVTQDDQERNPEED